MTTHPDDPADDLVTRLKAAAFTVDSLICAESETHRVYPDPTSVTQAIDEAAARIRSLEAQRDKAVGHLKRLTNEVAFDAFGRVSFGPFFLPLLKEARAFLDSLTEKR